MVLLLIASLSLVDYALSENYGVLRYEQMVEQMKDRPALVLAYLYPFYLASKARVPWLLIGAGVFWLSGIAVWLLSKKGLLAWFLIISLLILPTASVTAWLA